MHKTTFRKATSVRRHAWQLFLFSSLLSLLLLACSDDSELPMNNANTPAFADTDHNPNAPWQSSDPQHPSSGDTGNHGTDTHNPWNPTPPSTDTTTTNNNNNSPDPDAPQTAMGQFNLQCDNSKLLNGTGEQNCHNSPSPCIPYDYRITCTLQVRDGNNNLQYDGPVSIRRRGQSSRNYNKPSYNFEMQTDSGENNPHPLLGMGKEQDWVFDASWADRSFLRNAIAYDIFRELGPQRWAPRSRFGQMTFNGQRQGIYRLSETIKRDRHRLNIDKDDGSGTSFVIKERDRQQENKKPSDSPVLTADLGFFNDHDLWKLLYPNKRDVTDAQIRGVQSWLTGLAAALPQGRAFDYLDMGTTVDWLLMQEFTKNIDGYIRSVYFYKDSGDSSGKGHFVPWDFDLAMGQPTVTEFNFGWPPQTPDPNQTNNDAPAGFARMSWSDIIPHLTQVPALVPAMTQRWQELRQGILSKANIDRRVDDYLVLLQGQAIADNFSVWPISAVSTALPQVFGGMYQFYSVTSYDDEIAKWRQWIHQRLEWLDANIHTFPG